MLDTSCLLRRLPAGRRRAASLAVWCAGLALLAGMTLVTASDALAAGGAIVSVGSTTGEKPQSKIWYHDGSWWAVLDGPSGVAIFENAGGSWSQAAFADAVLSGGGQADVKWNGSRLLVLVYTASPKYFEFTYDAATRAYELEPGFPVSVPKPGGSETMVLEQDSTGRVWLVAEGGGDINVVHSTNAAHTSWSSAIVLQSGVNADDIASIIAFGGDRIGVFWSDQNRDEFGFRVHQDADPPGTWGAKEVVDSGSGVADDHLNLAFDSSGRVYAITKDDFDRHALHRRSTGGSWTTVSNVTGGDGTRGIVMVAEDDNEVYVLYTNWDATPNTIAYRKASLSTLNFGGQTTFMSSSGDMNNVTGMKQVLPAGALMAISTKDDVEAWWNSFGSPPGGTGPPPAVPPANLAATLDRSVPEVTLTWDVPTSGLPDGYNVYRQVGGSGSFVQLNAGLVTSTNFTDASPPGDVLCYQVSAVTGGNETAPSNTDCVDNTPPEPPANLTATLDQVLDQVDLAWDVPVTGSPDGYNLYRQASGGPFVKVNAGLLTSTSYTDVSPPAEPLCYEVTGVTAGIETGPSNTACVDNTPPLPPDAPVLASVLVDSASANGIVLDLGFEAGAGPWADDASGWGNHGRLGVAAGADAADPTWVAGHTGSGALHFDGIDDGVEVADAAALDLQGDWTCEMWVRRGSATAGTLLEKGAGGSRNLRVRLTSGGAVEFTWDEMGGGSPALSTGDLLGTTSWHHVACVHDSSGGEARIYVDGLLEASAPLTDVPVTNAQALWIGRDAGGASAFDGDLDGLRIRREVRYATAFVPPVAAEPAPQVHLQWQAAATGVPAVGFFVERQVGAGAFARLNAAALPGSTFVDAAAPDSSVCYRVVAVSSVGLESIASNTSCATVGPPLPAPPAAPLNPGLTLQSGTPERVVVTWVAPAGPPAPAGYHVYRARNGALPARKTLAPVDSTSWSDTLLVAGTLCYTVRAIDALGREGAAAAETCLTYVPPPPMAPVPLAAVLDTLPPGASGGVAAYRADADSGQVLFDATGNGHDGRLGDDPTPDAADPAWVPGVTGAALSLDGSDDYAFVPDAPDLQIAGSFTVEAWIQKRGTAAGCVLSKGASQKRNYWIVIEPDGAIDFRWETPGGANHGATSSPAVTDTLWHHVACVYDMQAGESRIYLDGVLVEQIGDSGTPTTSTDDLYIGKRISTRTFKDHFEGSIDLVRVTDAAIYTADFTPPTAYGGGPTPVIRIDWQPPASGAVASYEVYRAVESAPESLLVAGLTDTTYADADSLVGRICYRIAAVDSFGQRGAMSDTLCIEILVTTAIGEDDGGIRAPAPLRASPNPFNPATTIHFALARKSVVDLTLFDVAGRRVVRLLRNATLPEGTQIVRWNGRDEHGRRVAAGTYFLRLQAGKRIETRKLTLVK